MKRRNIYTTVLMLFIFMAAADTCLAGEIEKEDSIFGVGYAALKPPGLARTYENTGIRWFKVANAQWQFIEPFKPVKGHVYSWKLFDAIVTEYQASGFNLQIILRAKSKWASKPMSNKRLDVATGGIVTTPPKDEYWDDYGDFVQAVVERYDGDGIADMPGLRYPILYYEIESEIQHAGAWEGTVEEYLRLLGTAYSAAKKAQSRVKIILAGFDVGDIFDDFPSREEAERRMTSSAEVSKELGIVVDALRATDRYDIVEFHYNRDYKGIFGVVDFIRQHSNKTIWAGDASSGPFLFSNPKVMFTQYCPPLIAKSLFKKITSGDARAVTWYRAEQARLTTKKIVAAAGESVKKIFMELVGVWAKTPGMGGFHNNFYLTNMVGQDLEPLPVFDTLRLLVEKLDGYTQAGRIDVGNSFVYLYRFAVNNKHVYVVWYDDMKNRLPGMKRPSINFTLPVDKKMHITPIITGIEEENPGAVSSLSPGGGLRLNISDTPLILEPR